MTRLVRVLDCRIMVELAPDGTAPAIPVKTLRQIAERVATLLTSQGSQDRNGYGCEDYSVISHGYTQVFPDTGPVFNHDDAYDDLERAYRPTASHLPKPSLFQRIKAHRRGR